MQLPIKNIDNTKLYYRPDSHDHSMLLEIWKEKSYGKYFPFGKKTIVVASFRIRRVAL